MMGLPRRREGAKKWDENAIAKVVVEEALSLHKELGPGLLESVYEVLLADSLSELGLGVCRQVPVPVVFRGKTFTEGFRADLVIENKVCIELKSATQFSKADPKQLRTYLRLLNFKLGLLINFGSELLKDGIIRVVNGLENDPYSPRLRAFAPSREAQKP